MLGDMPMDGRRDRSDSDIAQRKIFIGGLSYGTDDDKLRKYFSAYGAVQDAVVMKDPVSRRSRGFGFITFHDPHSVDVALSNEPHTIDARRVEAKRAVPRSEARDALFPQGLGLQVTGRATTSAWAVSCALHACVCFLCWATSHTMPFLLVSFPTIHFQGKTAANRSASTSSDSSTRSSATQAPGSPVVSVAGDPLSPSQVNDSG